MFMVLKLKQNRLQSFMKLSLFSVKLSYWFNIPSSVFCSYALLISSEISSAFAYIQAESLELCSINSSWTAYSVAISAAQSLITKFINSFCYLSSISACFLPYSPIISSTKISYEYLASCTNSNTDASVFPL